MAKAYLTESLRAQVMACHDSCVACGTWDARHVGHIVAESRGGATVLANLVRMCEFCNTVALGNANLELSSFASMTESRALIETRRAFFLAYASKARDYWNACDRVANGKSKANPYRKPAPFNA
jgi:hypothetical protein